MRGTVEHEFQLFGETGRLGLGVLEYVKNMNDIVQNSRVIELDDFITTWYDASFYHLNKRNPRSSM